jgi:hypothetical protein
MVPLAEKGLLTEEYEELIDISTSTGLKDTYTNISMINLWVGLKEDFHITQM